MLRRPLLVAALLGVAIAGQLRAGSDAPIPPRVIISVRDQKLMVIDSGQKLAVYPVSTSRFGIGDRWGSMTTPLGWLQVAEKIGDHAPLGAVFHNRRFTGEVLPPNAPGRDPIVTRIIWLRGLETENAHAFQRGIYIHGTPQEKSIGRPASYGCIRMSSRDVASLYTQLEKGALVRIIPDSLPRLPQAKNNPAKAVFTAAAPRQPAQPMKAATAKGGGKEKRVSTLRPRSRTGAA